MGKDNKIDVEIKSGEIIDDAEIFRKCNFCTKETLIEKDNCLDKLCQPGKFYCRFCLRNGYNSRGNRHVLMMTVRSILGYYFWQFYQSPSRPYMWLSEIKDYISIQQEIGLRNPLFNYDPETYIWFVDFTRIGDSKKKLPLSEIKKTLIEILSSFNLHVHVKGCKMSLLYMKFSEAIDEFYQHRARPDGKKLLAPTLKGCGTIEWGHLTLTNQIILPGNKIAIEETRNFTHVLMDENLWNKMGN